MARAGGNSNDRRRTRRASQRRLDRSGALAATPETFLAEVGLDDDLATLADGLVAASSGSTSLPLSDQGHTWDASAADKRVRSWAGADDAPNAKYGRAFFVKQGDGTNFGDYRLGYADVVDGTLTAIWRGVTAVAGALQGARGGVKGLSDAEVSSVKSKVASYYSKAAKQYDDDSIKVPWEADGSKGESAITLLALAELTPAEKADLDLDHTDGRVAMIGGSGAGMDAFLERRSYWEAEYGGKPTPGTKPDRRLKENQDGTPEVFALERILEFAPGDVSWGPEDGFIDLLCDVNELLGGNDDDDPYGTRYRAIDVGVKLDKVLIYDYDDESRWSAPISIDAQGEPMLSDRSEWRPVEEGLIEVAAPEDDDDGAATISAPSLRFQLLDLVLTADGALAPELPDEHQPGEKMPRRRPSPGSPKPMPPSDIDQMSGKEIAWQALFLPEGMLTDDGRAFAPGSLTWRDLPLSLMAMTETSAQGGHDGAVLAGRIDRIWREGNLIMAAGVFDPGEFGTEIARMVGEQTLRGLSVDTAIHTYEIGPRSDYFNEDGTWRTESPTRDETNDPNLADMLFDGKDEDRIFVVTEAVIGMATVCPFPAFADANVSLVAAGGGAIWRYTHHGALTLTLRDLAVEEEGEVVKPNTAALRTAQVTIVPRSMEVEIAETGERMTIELSGDVLVEGQVETEEDSLTASAAGHAPVAPPAEWFENPELEELTPLMIDDDGRVVGHAWSWDTCHIAFPDSCVLAPHTETENAYFHLGEIECADGSKLSVGKITLDAPHAAARLSRADATAHYDHTGTVVAHVVSGEDEFGGWVAGAIVPDLPESKLRLLQGSALSGDWRNVNGNLELVALLAVNVPGFPVPRPRALVAAGEGGTEEVLALTAAGIFAGRTPCDTVAEIGELAAEIGAEPLEKDAATEFADLVEQVEA